MNDSFLISTWFCGCGVTVPPPPPAPLSFPTPGKTVPHHPLGDGPQVTVPHHPLGDRTTTIHAHLQAQKNFFADTRLSSGHLASGVHGHSGPVSMYSMNSVTFAGTEIAA